MRKPKNEMTDASTVNTTEVLNDVKADVSSISTTETFLPSNFGATPPKYLKRNYYGLLEDHNYIFAEDGIINWRAMVKSDFLVPNKQYFNEQQLADFKNGEKKIEEASDEKLLILLAGIKELAKLRGYLSVSYLPIFSSDYSVALRCRIEWIGNYETQGQPITFESTADATIHNTSGLGKKFLTTIAENRAFVRCVKNFLGIYILGKDEISEDVNLSTGEDQPSPKKPLINLLKDNDITFIKFKNRMMKLEVEGADTWESLDDIPNDRVFDLINTVKQILKDKMSSKA